MFKSVYKRLANDFAFLQDFGFQYSRDECHYVRPSVIFSNRISEIQIGMHYEDKRMYVIYYKDKNPFSGINILENVQLQGDTYEKQLFQVIYIVGEYLSSL